MFFRKIKEEIETIEHEKHTTQEQLKLVKKELKSQIKIVEKMNYKRLLLRHQTICKLKFQNTINFSDDKK